MITWGRSQSLLDSRQRLLLGNVHHGAGQMPAFQRRDQIALDNQRSPGDIDQHGPRFHLLHRRGVDHPPRRGVQRHAEDQEIDQRQQLVEPFGRPKRFDPVGLVDGEHVDGQDPRFEGR